MTWEDSRTQLTSPPKVITPLEAAVPWERDENDAIDDEEEEDSDDDEDDDDRVRIPEITFTSSFDDITKTSVLLHNSYRCCPESSDEPDSVVESYSSASTVTFQRTRPRLCASASDLTSMQQQEDPWLRTGVVAPRPNVRRSLDDIRHLLSRGSPTNSEGGGTRERIESLELADNLSATFRWSYNIDELMLMSMTKEDIVRMWQGSERALLNRLQDINREKRVLEQHLSFMKDSLLLQSPQGSQPRQPP